MTDKETDQPNEFGFSGGATAPEPRPSTESADEANDSIAVPAGDLTGSITEGLEEATQRDDRS